MLTLVSDQDNNPIFLDLLLTVDDVLYLVGVLSFLVYGNLKGRDLIVWLVFIIIKVFE